MESVEPFEKKLQSILAAHAARHRCEQTEVDSRMTERIEHERQFNEAAQGICLDVFESRLGVLEDLFDDVECKLDVPHFRGYAIFNAKKHFSGAFKLELEITPGAEFKTADISFRLTIVPIFVHFKKDDKLTVPVADLTPECVIPLVEDAVQSAVVAYLEYRINRNYFLDDFVRTDPVCNMTVYTHSAHSMAMHGDSEYHFCSQVCQEKFEANPELFK